MFYLVFVYFELL